MTRKEMKAIENGMRSIPMTIILKLKKQLNFLLVLNLVLIIILTFSFYDSIKIRDNYWEDHTQNVVDAIRNHCENERDAAWHD